MPMERDCPKCPFTPLESKKSLGLDLDECPKCGGRWYDRGELERAVIDPAALKREGGVALGKSKPGKAMCALCHETMQSGPFLNPLLLVDQCVKCGGVWLDKNEIALVDKLITDRG